MTSIAEARSAAERYAGDIVDAEDDPNMELERQLVEDDYFRGLAVAAEQLDVLDVYGDAGDCRAGRFADTARQNLGLAMEERAEEVLDITIGRTEVTA
jgi:hypothetical protein